MEPTDPRIDMGWDLLEQGELRGALEAAEALLSENPAHGEAAFLAATALMEMGEREQAESRLLKLLELQPDNDPARLTYAGLLYESCRLEESEAQMARLGPGMLGEAFAHWLRGLLHDAHGRRQEADESFARAARLDPERFESPMSVPRAEFEEVVREALESLPPEFATKIQGLPVVVEETPSTALLASLEDPSPDLLGLFIGTPLTLQSHADTPSLPPTIYLFKRNLERECSDRDDLVEQIRVTLLHEVGHYLGMGEEDLDDAGYS